MLKQKYKKVITLQDLKIAKSYINSIETNVANNIISDKASLSLGEAALEDFSFAYKNYLATDEESKDIRDSIEFIYQYSSYIMMLSFCQCRNDKKTFEIGNVLVNKAQSHPILLSNVSILHELSKIPHKLNRIKTKPSLSQILELFQSLSNHLAELKIAIIQNNGMVIMTTCFDEDRQEPSFEEIKMKNIAFLMIIARYAMYLLQFIITKINSIVFSMLERIEIIGKIQISHTIELQFMHADTMFPRQEEYTERKEAILKLNQSLEEERALLNTKIKTYKEPPIDEQLAFINSNSKKKPKKKIPQKKPQKKPVSITNNTQQENNKQKTPSKDDANLSMAVNPSPSTEDIRGKQNEGAVTPVKKKKKRKNLAGKAKPTADSSKIIIPRKDIDIPEYILEIMKKIEENGSVCHIFGGAARDRNFNKDVDIVTNITSDELQKLFSPMILSKGILRRDINAIVHVLTILGKKFDIVCPINFVLLDFVDGLDITINAGFINSKGVIQFIHPEGLKDLNNGIIRIINPNQDKEKLLPIALRAIAFSNRTAPNGNLFVICKRDDRLIRNSFQEHVVTDHPILLRKLDKLFLEGHALDSLNKLIDYNLLDCLFSSISNSLNLPMLLVDNQSFKQYLLEKFEEIDHSSKVHSVDIFMVLIHFYMKEMEQMIFANHGTQSMEELANSFIENHALLNAFNQHHQNKKLEIVFVRTFTSLNESQKLKYQSQINTVETFSYSRATQGVFFPTNPSQSQSAVLTEQAQHFQVNKFTISDQYGQNTAYGISVQDNPATVVTMTFATKK